MKGQRFPLAREVPIRSNQCFLCGTLLRDGTSSDEHIFPKWLLHEFDLWDARLTLLNGKSKPYRQVRIPCCRVCNNGPLSRLENKVQSAYFGGFSAFAALPEETAFHWALKIVYELLHLEKRTLLVPAKKYIGTTISAADLKRYRACHTRLQSILVKTHSKGDHFSVFRFRLRQHQDKSLSFWYRDNLPGLSLSIQMGEIGLVVCLEDGGSVRWDLGKYIDRMSKRLLHPLQFKELAAAIAYKSAKLNRVPKYVTVEGKDERHMITMPIAGFSSKPVFDKWDNTEFSHVLSIFCGIPREQLLTAEGTGTFLESKPGRFRVIEDPAYA